MGRTGKRGGKQESTQPLDGFLPEYAVPLLSNLTVPALGRGGNCHLRLLDDFSLFTQLDKGYEETPCGLEQLPVVLAEGLQLRGKGTLLEHKHCAVDVAEARAHEPRTRVRLGPIQDWVLDFSHHGAIWVLTEVSWYRLLTPSPAYAQRFSRVLLKALLAWRLSALVRREPGISYERGVAQLLGSRWEEREAAADPEETHLPYRGMLLEADVTEAAVQKEAGFLARVLGPLLGRHAAKCGLLCTLAQAGGFPPDALSTLGRRVLVPEVDSPAADPERRPRPHASFLAPPPLFPALLLIWDFCQLHRGVLRLPPFPLTRVELAFLDERPGLGREAEPCRHPLANGHSKHSWLGDPSPGGGVEVAEREEEQRERVAAAEKLGEPASAYGAAGQATLLRDLHASALRVIEALDEEAQELPTLAGYGSAASLGPQAAYKPLLSITWPELVRHSLSEQPPGLVGEGVLGALAALKQTEYRQLPGSCRATLLEALLHSVADTETLRGHLGYGGRRDRLGRPYGKLGSDEQGNTYYRLGADAGAKTLFVESGGEQRWGSYDLEGVKALIAWLDSGSLQEQDLADVIHEAYGAALSGLPSASSPEQEAEGDGYRLSEPFETPGGLLGAELAGLLGAVRFWEKDADWLQARAAVLGTMADAAALEGRDWAKLVWVVEELVYDDLLKGTGWGRKRGWCKEQLAKTRTLAQAAVVACQIASHSRKPHEMGHIGREEVVASVGAERAELCGAPVKGSQVAMVRKGYMCHLKELCPPDVPPETPSHWDHAEQCTVTELAWSKGHWQRPVWQGRFAQNAPAPPQDGLVAAWALLERSMPEAASSSVPEIDWRTFTFQTGFRPPKHYTRVPIPLGRSGYGTGVGGLLTQPAMNGRLSEGTGSEAAFSVQENGVKMEANSESSAYSNRLGAMPSGRPQRGPPSGVGQERSNSRERGLDGEYDPVEEGEEGGEEGSEEAKVLTRSKRGNSDFIMLDKKNKSIMHKKAMEEMAAAEARARALAAGAELDEEGQPGVAGAETESIKFWRPRDLCPVAVYVRPETDSGPGATLPSPHMIPWEAYSKNSSRSWPQGLPIKVEAGPRVPLPQGLGRPPGDSETATHLTGVVATSWGPFRYDPTPEGGSKLVAADPWGAVEVKWDPDTPPFQSRMSPWEVSEDEGGALRAEKRQLVPPHLQGSFREVAVVHEPLQQPPDPEAYREAARRKAEEARAREKESGRASGRLASRSAATEPPENPYAKPRGVSLHSIGPSHQPPRGQAARSAALQAPRQPAEGPWQASAALPSAGSSTRLASQGGPQRGQQPQGDIYTPGGYARSVPAQEEDGYREEGEGGRRATKRVRKRSTLLDGDHELEDYSEPPATAQRSRQSSRAAAPQGDSQRKRPKQEGPSNPYYQGGPPPRGPAGAREQGTPPQRSRQQPAKSPLSEAAEEFAPSSLPQGRGQRGPKPPPQVVSPDATHASSGWLPPRGQREAPGGSRRDGFQEPGRRGGTVPALNLPEAAMKVPPVPGLTELGNPLAPGFPTPQGMHPGWGQPPNRIEVPSATVPVLHLPDPASLSHPQGMSHHPSHGLTFPSLPQFAPSGGRLGDEQEHLGGRGAVGGQQEGSRDVSQPLTSTYLPTHAGQLSGLGLGQQASLHPQHLGSNAFVHHQGAFQPLPSQHPYGGQLHSLPHLQGGGGYGTLSGGLVGQGYGDPYGGLQGGGLYGSHFGAEGGNMGLPPSLDIDALLSQHRDEPSEDGGPK